MATIAAEMQKWFDQNQTSRSTKPMSAPVAASKRALASFENNLLRQWRLARLTRFSGSTAIAEGTHGSGVGAVCSERFEAPGFGNFLGPLDELLLGAPLGLESEHGTRCLPA